VDDVRPIASEELVEILSHGMAFVTFVARARGEGARLSVCKRVRLAAMGDEAVRKLEREGDVLHALGGHGAPALLARGADEFGPFVSMELVRGRRMKTLDDARVAFGALAELHARGIVHGDVSPSNVIIGDVGTTAWLIDFEGAFTTAFAAPERARGDAFDERADVFSMAASIVTCATGVPARSFDDLPQAAQLAMAGEKPLDDAFVALAPKALRECLAFDPNMRPRGAAAVLTRLV
jgi:serine/threonine protein kinase